MSPRRLTGQGSEAIQCLELDRIEEEPFVLEDGVDHVVDGLHVERHALFWFEIVEIRRRRWRVAVFVERARSQGRRRRVRHRVR